MRPLTLPELLRRNRVMVVCSASVAYVLYAVLTAMVDPPREGLMALSNPKNIAAFVALLTAATTLLRPQAVQGVYAVTSVGYLLVAMLEVPRAVAWGDMPMHLTLWLTLNVLVSYLVFGTRLGTAVNVVCALSIVVSLLMNGPVEPSNVADWITALIVMGGTGVIAFSVMRFIEQNLSVHLHTDARLRAARKDALTEVLGRSATEEELQRSIQQALNNRAPLSIIVTDIDHFKHVNDVHGHGTGDDVLRSFGKRLRRSVGGSGGQVGRWGGEEFLLILPGLARTDALAVAERLRAEVAGEPIAGLDITASFGVGSLRGAEDSAADLFARADSAMYNAKRSGRNAVR
ncbi:GGDEF domain-containing protein [Deinococcus radiotolerans]|uniref:GGDEF domain-containing protein n=1 Tax=Deinococcus radiotolerans TaxID=1309407 RepID=A0ABQ2FLP4_9DEIO|nr:GGDEF domain-containing protein [Deinococcus radiotolerans]GGL07464.1 GGDEF domain-containing protein [Deinococcus radiotolerans]